MDIDERVLRVEHKEYWWTTRNWLESDRIRYEKRRDSSFRPHPLHQSPPILSRRITHGESYTHLMHPRTMDVLIYLLRRSFGIIMTADVYASAYSYGKLVIRRNTLWQCIEICFICGRYQVYVISTMHYLLWKHYVKVYKSINFWTLLTTSNWY